MRITRRDFMKYCAVAAGALGLTASDLGKIQKAMATEYPGGTHVIWLNGAACTGCTVTLANSMYYATIQDLLVPWVAANAALGIDAQTLGLSLTNANGPLDLDFIETLNSSVGAMAVQAAQQATAEPFVLCIEGAIQTAENGNFCRIGAGTDYSDTDTTPFWEEVEHFATHANCLAVIAVGTCASYGGIPAAKGSITEARGLISTGKISGGYNKKVEVTGLWDWLRDTDSGTQRVSSITVNAGGSGYTVAPTVTIDAAPAGGVDATAVAELSAGVVVRVVVTNRGSGYTSTPAVAFSDGAATATAIMQDEQYIDAATWTDLMGKTICIAGCPPHPDWIVGTIVYFLTYSEPPLMDKWHRPFDFYGEYQCTNCLWQDNMLTQIKDIDDNDQASRGGATVGNSPMLFKEKYNSAYEGCIGILGCKGRKTKADCSYRKWNTLTNQSQAGDKVGVGSCIETRAGCHGCTDPRFPDGWGKFFSYK